MHHSSCWLEQEGIPCSLAGSRVPSYCIAAPVLQHCTAPETQARQEPALRASHIHLGVWGQRKLLFRDATTSSHSSSSLIGKDGRAALVRSKQVSLPVWSSLGSTAFPWRISQAQNHKENMIGLCCGMIYVYTHLVGGDVHIKNLCGWSNVPVMGYKMYPLIAATLKRNFSAL